MPITFEEVTGEITPEPTRGAGTEAAPRREPPAADMAEQVQRTLRLLDERAARVVAD